MKKSVGRMLGWGGICLPALLLAAALLGMDSQSAAAQSLEQQQPMTGTMRGMDTMPMTGTMPMMDTMPMTDSMMMGGSGMAGGDMAHMMQMMTAMEARMSRMESMMESMHGSMPMSSQGDMMGQGNMTGDQGQGNMMGQGNMTGDQGQGNMMGQGGMMGQGSMMGQGNMMGDQGQGGMMGHHHMHMMMDMMMLMHMQHMMGQGCMMGHGSMMGQGGMMDDGGMGGMMDDEGMGEGDMSSHEDAQGHAMGAASPMTDTMGAGPGPQAGHADERSATLGDIQLRVTPANRAASSGDTVDFTVDLESQGAGLDFDLAESAMLMVGSEEVPASGWKVNFDHGHHVNGTLSFPRADVEPLLADGGTLMLHIGAPTGDGQAMFSWELHE